MTAPMPETMKCPKCSYRSGDDWEQCNGSCPIPGSPHYTAALASSGDQLSGNPGQLKSGDHSELAKILRASKRDRHGIYGRVLVNPDGPAAADALESLLADIAALREENGGLAEAASRSEARLLRATEAERKLAEAEEENGDMKDRLSFASQLLRDYVVLTGEGHDVSVLNSETRTFLSKEAERG